MLRKMKRTARGQSTAEYAIVIALVLGAAIAMQTYVRRTIQDRVADSADRIPQINLTAGSGVPVPVAAKLNVVDQFEPGYAAAISNASTNVTGNATLSGASGSASPVSYTATTLSNRNGQNVEAGAN